MSGQPAHSVACTHCTTVSGISPARSVRPMGEAILALVGPPAPCPSVFPPDAMRGAYSGHGEVPWGEGAAVRIFVMGLPRPPHPALRALFGRTAPAVRRARVAPFTTTATSAARCDLSRGRAGP